MHERWLCLIKDTADETLLRLVRISVKTLLSNSPVFAVVQMHCLRFKCHDIGILEAIIQHRNGQLAL